MKEIVEAMNKPKPGLIQMARIPDKSSFFTEAGQVQSFTQTHGSSSDEDNVRNLMELMQKVGMDRVQQMLNAQSQRIEVDDEWMQNFD
jgi:hypothetical protein